MEKRPRVPGELVERVLDVSEEIDPTEPGERRSFRAAVEVLVDELDSDDDEELVADALENLDSETSLSVGALDGGGRLGQPVESRDSRPRRRDPDGFMHGN